MNGEEKKRQEAVAEAVLFTMGQSVEIRQLAAALECGEEEAEAADDQRRRDERPGERREPDDQRREQQHDPRGCRQREGEQRHEEPSSGGFVFHERMCGYLPSALPRTSSIFSSAFPWAFRAAAFALSSSSLAKSLICRRSSGPD